MDKNSYDITEFLHDYTEDSPDKEIKIINAAINTFSEKGFEATRTKEIAERAGIAEGTIFRYFPTKSAILERMVPLLIRVMLPKISMPIDQIISDYNDAPVQAVFQAILLAHGGLTTLGANTFSMAIAGPFLSYGIYKLCQKLNVNRKVAVFLAAFFGDLFTYCVTSLQLAMAYPSEAGGVGVSAVKFLGVFAPTQLPLAVMEGLLTVVIVIALESYAKPELKAVGFLKEEK